MTLVEFCNEYKDLLEDLDKDFPRGFSIKGEEIYQQRFEIYKEEPLFFLNGILHSIKIAFSNLEEKTEEFEEVINYFDGLKLKLDCYPDSFSLDDNDLETARILTSLFRQKVHL